MRVLALLAAVLVSSTVHAAEWTQFRADELHTGAVPVTGLGPYLDFETPTQLWWKRPVGGPIEGGPVVAEGRVFVGATDGKLYAFDAVTGVPLWVFDAKDPVSTTPALFGGILYFGSVSGKLFAIDAATGKERTTTAVKSPDPGPSRTSVTVHEGRLYLGTEAGSVVAYNPYTLTKDWEYHPLQELKLDGTECLERFPTSKPVRSTPAVFRDTVYFGSDLHHLFAVHEFGLGGVGAGRTYSVWGPDGALKKCDRADEDETLQEVPDVVRPALAPKMNDVIRASPAIDPNSGPVDAVTLRPNGLVIAASYDHTVRAFDARTGQQYWSFEVQPVPGGVDTRVISSPAVDAEGRLYFGSFNGRFYALQTVPPNGTTQWPTVRELWHFDAGAPIWSSPALSNGRVAFGADNGYLYVLDAGSGAPLYQYRTSDDVRSSPAVWTGGLPDLPFRGGLLYVGSSDGNLYAFGGEKPLLPDLAIVKLTKPAKPLIGAIENLTIVVANEGAGIAAPTTLDLYTGKILAARFQVPELLPGFNATFVHPWKIPTGNASIRAVVDPQMKVREWDRSDNNVSVESERATKAPVKRPTPARNTTSALQQQQAAKKSPGLEVVGLGAALALAALAAAPRPPREPPRPPRWATR